MKQHISTGNDFLSMGKITVNQQFRKKLLAASMMVVGSGMIIPAMAQSTPETLALEEIVVTADFRDAGLMSSAASISVLSEALMEERGAQHIEDILSAAPNISWSTGASRSRFIQIRGVGDLEQYAEPKYYPAVGIVLDDMELGSAANAGMLFDVAQVEVLRGPQGTRFGSSAHAGIVNIIAIQTIAHF